MKFIVFSDSHGNSARMSEVVRRNMSFGLDGMIFLGDGIKDAQLVAERYGLTLYAVNGNNDFDPFAPRRIYERIETFDSVTVMLMHGHRMNSEEANRMARREGASILFCGHTHKKEDFIRRDDLAPDGNIAKPLRIFNPGSISQPRDGGEPSFGFFEIRNGNVYLTHAEVRF